MQVRQVRDDFWRDIERLQPKPENEEELKDWRPPEPTDADCVAASIEHGEVTTIPGPQLSMMAGLNCGTPSLIAWPDVSAGYDSFVTITDDQVADAMRLLAADDIVSGESGAAGLGGLLAHRDVLGINDSDSVLVVSTEGATDLANYRSIVGAETSPA